MRFPFPAETSGSPSAVRTGVGAPSSKGAYFTTAAAGNSRTSPLTGWLSDGSATSLGGCRSLASFLGDCLSSASGEFKQQGPLARHGLPIGHGWLELPLVCGIHREAGKVLAGAGGEEVRADYLAAAVDLYFDPDFYGSVNGSPCARRRIRRNPLQNASRGVRHGARSRRSRVGRRCRGRAIRSTRRLGSSGLRGRQCAMDHAVDQTENNDDGGSDGHASPAP